MRQLLFFYIVILYLTACSSDVDINKNTKEEIAIFPDYKYVTVPYNIAPLNFSVLPEYGKIQMALLEVENNQWQVRATNGEIHFPINKWHSFLFQAKGKEIKVTVVCQKRGINIAYQPYTFRVSQESIDKFLVYRLIEPGYEIWNQMGIYQRNLETFEQTAIIENKITKYNCINCHSFCNGNPEQYIFHMRASLGGTIIKNGNILESLNTKTEHTLSSFTYPYWHPSGKYIAFSINKTTQGFHPKQRVEVYDSASDVIVYDIKNHAILSTPLLASERAFETFPTFSPDGKYLYFCTAPIKTIPDSVCMLKYNLCRVNFDAEYGTFGETIDTIYYANKKGKSFSFPRISPDGTFLMGTISDYGTFPIWHKDADLYLIDLNSQIESNLSHVNSEDTESYHSWSSNGRWIVFSSRRLDGLYTRLFLAYISASGKVDKPFLLPLKNARDNWNMLKSFNVPEFVTGKVKNESIAIRKLVEQGNINVKFRGEELVE